MTLLPQISSIFTMQSVRPQHSIPYTTVQNNSVASKNKSTTSTQYRSPPVKNCHGG